MGGSAFGCTFPLHWDSVSPFGLDTAGNGATHGSLSDTNQNYHDYTVCMPLSFTRHVLTRVTQIDWQPDTLKFLIDGQEVRIVNKADTLVNGVYQYPTSPARVQLSVWAGGIAGSPQVSLHVGSELFSVTYESCRVLLTGQED